MSNHFLILRTGILTTGLLLGGTVLAADAKKPTAAAKAKANAKETVKDVKEAAKEARQELKEDINEAMLGSKVRLALLKSLKGADSLRVSVAVHGTAVTLSGEIEDRASEKMASEATKAVEGVGTVTSTITHNPKAPHQENFDRNVKDAMLVSEVRLRLLQDLGTAGIGIHVTATDGAVSLRGSMPNETMHSKSLECVKAITGVTRVEDLMTVTP